MSTHPTLEELLARLRPAGATDLHLTPGRPPLVRIDNDLYPMEGVATLDAKAVEDLCLGALGDVHRRHFEANHECDFAFLSEGLRYRANVFRQRGEIVGAFRTVPDEAFDFETLGLPEVVRELCHRPRGLVLVTGPTGSGKSTTLAAMIDHINETEQSHIVTLEDPIEYIHEHKRSVVHQREVGSDTESFHKALRFITRQDPDVILIGEMRDRETVEAALTVAETGHLTFATLHTNSCAQTISRILDIFPPERQPQVRTQLSMVLEGVVSQQLLRRRDGGGRVLALELMIPNAAIRHMIREGKDHQIFGAMQCGQGRSEMRTMNQSLVALLKDHKIDLDEALAASSEPEALEAMVSERMLGGIRVDVQEAMMARTRRLSGARGEAAQPASSLRRHSTLPTVGGRP